LPKSERILLWSLAALSLGLRAVAFFNYRFDADEQQHLHVTWGWTAGLVQYRDYFDNHAPLFHLGTAPILALLGERSDILHWMRIPMLALFAAVLWATYVIARDLYDERVAVWATMLLSLFPPFFLKSLEYRTDNLWTALWMIALVMLIRQRRPFLTGLLLGCAFATSLKTTLLVVSLIVAAMLAKRGGAWIKTAIGFAIVPSALLIFFASAGAWDELVYCTFTFNSNVSLTRSNLWIQRAIFPFTAGALLYVAWRFRRTAPPWRYFFAVVMGVFSVTLAGFWVLISPRDFLPLMPLAAIFASAMLLRARRPLHAIGATAAVFVAALWYYADRFENRTAWHTTMMDQVLRLSKPGEPLIDHKGETIYRPRPFYFIFENITRAQIARGIIKDTLPEDVVRTRTYVAQADGAMWPPRARAFLSQNFVNLGRLRAAGQWLREDGRFTIAIPGEYVVVSERGAMTVPRRFDAGAYRYHGRRERLAVVWAPAIRRGHSPFHLRDVDY
jgi:hypothetical protein